MSIECMRWVIEGCASLRNPARAVLQNLAWHANAVGADTFPSFDTIAAETGLVRRTVINCMRQLEADGYIRVEERGGPQRANRYTVLMNSAPHAPQVIVQDIHQCTTCTTVVQDIHHSSAPRAPEPSLTVIEPPEKKNTNNARAEIPSTLVSFDAILRESGQASYAPTAAFYSKVMEKYIGLDLEEEAIKLVGWLETSKAKKLKRVLNTAFVLNWLGNASRDRRKDEVVGRNPHSAGEPRDTKGPQGPQRSGAGDVSPFAKFSGTG